MYNRILYGEKPMPWVAGFVSCGGLSARSDKNLANLPPVSTTPAVPVAIFVAGVVDTGGASSLADISVIFRKLRKDPNIIFGGLGEDDLWKKPEAKHLMTLSL